MTTRHTKINPGKSQPGTSSRLRRLWNRWGLWFVFVILLMGIPATAWLYHSWNTPFRGYSENQKLLCIRSGTQTDVIVGHLQRNGVIKRELPVWLYLAWHHNRGGVKAGEYQFQDPMTVVEVAEKLIQGKVQQHSITIPEGLTVWQTAALMESEGLGSIEESLEAAKKTDLIRDIDPKATDLEGYLYPDTYYYVQGARSQDLAEQMVRRFKELFGETWRFRAEEIGFNIREVVTLASLIEKETAVESERSIISAVFHSRLEKEIFLQCDPTIIYASTLIGKYDGKIRQSDLQLDSGYNTYIHAGLPPGPIANPGVKSIEAALYPAEVNYLYFVAKNDGTHHFSDTLAAHNKAVRTYRH